MVSGTKPRFIYKKCIFINVFFKFSFTFKNRFGEYYMERMDGQGNSSGDKGEFTIISIFENRLDVQ